MNRRTFLKTSGAAVLGTAAAGWLASCSSDSVTSSGAEGTGPGGPKRKVTLGFISLTDMAPLAIAKEKGIFDKYGLDVTLENGKSWPGVRDKLLNGEFDGAHALFSLPFSVATGISKIEGDQSKAKSLRIAMMLNQNGQAITLANDLSSAGYNNLPAAKDAIIGKGAKTFGQTFPGGTHDTWLRYWMRAAGIDWKANGIDLKSIPPPEMHNNLNQENVRGYCVGEPWNARSVAKDKGFTALATQDLWVNHPEKALVVNEKFATEKKDVLKDVMKALLEASKWLDEMSNRPEAAKIIGVDKYVNATPPEIEPRMLGDYELGAGLGKKMFDGTQMRFFRDGEVPFPRKAHAIWFMSQYVRLGHLTELPPARQLADQMILTDLYAEVAGSMGIKVPDDDMKSFDVVLDKATFDPTKPEDEAKRP